MTQKFNHFGIIGAGAWGTAIAAALIRAGRHVTIWANEADVVDSINNEHENKIFLPGVKLDASLRAVTDLQDMAACDAFVLVTPSQFVRALAQKMSFVGQRPVILASKGIDDEAGALLNNVVEQMLPQAAVAVLSGPSFAIEIAKGLPAALTLAIRDKALGEALVSAMATPSFRLYLSDDIVGAQIGGAIKNVLAVACGIITGRALGDNARAALITRGLAELTRLGIALGGRTETLMGLSGMGDLVLTCSCPQSRNMSLGIALGQGQKLADILASRKAVTEGVHTASSALKLAQKMNVDMPIVAAVDAVLNRKADIDAVMAGLLARPFKKE